jgi:hypothetical protein
MTIPTPNRPSEPELKFHSLADLFPLMDGKEFDAFVEDVKTRGQQEPITLYQGAIIEGRNRYRACLKLGVKAQTKEYTGNDPIGFVLSANLHRRHLNESQRSMIAAKVANMQRGGRDSPSGVRRTYLSAPRPSL